MVFRWLAILFVEILLVVLKRFRVILLIFSPTVNEKRGVNSHA